MAKHYFSNPAWRLQDLIGRVFGYWTVLDRGLNNGPKVQWVCRCTCGIEKSIRTDALCNGQSTDCGCRRKEKHRSKSRWHGQSTTTEFLSWHSMIQRCNNSKRTDFHNYGGRGITICDRWYDFFAFLADMGSKPYPKAQLERVNNDLGYFPDNCIWSNAKAQARNRRTNRLENFRGIQKPVVEWAEILGIRYGLILTRLHAGWSIERALTQPVRPKQK